MKTSNKELFDMYLNSVDPDLHKTILPIALCAFWDLVSDEGREYGEDPTVFSEAVKIADAIARNEEVQLKEKIYYVGFAGVFGSYLYKKGEDFKIGSSIAGMFTKSELENDWEKYFDYYQANLLTFEEV